jgi:hypothetical protein
MAKTRFGNHVSSPTAVENIDAIAAGGQLVGDIINNLNGSYTQLIRVLRSEPDPIVTTTIAGVTLPTVEVIKPFREFIGQFNPFVAAFLFDDSLAIDDGVTFGARLGFVWNKRFTIEAEFGATHTHDFSGNNGLVIQAGANLNVDLVYWRIIPFLTVGAGVIRFEDFSTTDNTSYVSFGGGFKLDISPRFSGRMTVRNFSISSNDFAADRTNNLQVDWGLIYSF